MPSLGDMYSFYTSFTKSLLCVAFARLYSPQDVPTRDLTGQTAIVTGANSGIGLSIAVALAQQGATVHLACRNADRGAAAVDHVINQCDEKSRERVSCRILDVSNLSSIRTFCEQWGRGEAKIDMLVHNAGIVTPPAGGSTHTKEGKDIVYMTNFLGSFLMTYLLEPHLSETARVVMTSSTSAFAAAGDFLHNDASSRLPAPKSGTIGKIFARWKEILGIKEKSYGPAYNRSKAQQVLFAALLQQHFDVQADHTRDSRVYRTAHVFTPGFTSTAIFGTYDVTWQTWFTDPLFAMLKTTEKWIAVNTDEGAKTGTWLATWGDEIGKRNEGGMFWERMQIRKSFVNLMDAKRKRYEWESWERDAEVLWNG